MNQVKIERVKIDYKKLCEELKKQGKTRGEFSLEMTKDKGFVGRMEKNPDQPKAIEQFMCVLLGLEEGSLIAADPAPELTDVAVLTNIHKQIIAEMKMLEEAAENIEKIWNKVHANTIQLERIKECVKGFEKSGYEKAIEFLKNALSDGKANSEEIMMRSDAAGIKRADLMKAKRDIGVDSSTTGYGKNQKTWWFLSN
ncbi:Uncharacterised protein [[Eubacterium] contortum]|uniref:Uncharacterized protein n=1 Tax=Faecalicatena contorta TaxID=39482 RepID=A0A174N4Y0_9FIRM|nr:hypothetical protein [Faecalicatena contorta]CUP43792.1 Uncharacterised protein [[Eubacterium] contortum] [Faecalicatena contorta]